MGAEVEEPEICVSKLAIFWAIFDLQSEFSPFFFTFKAYKYYTSLESLGCLVLHTTKLNEVDCRNKEPDFC